MADAIEILRAQGAIIVDPAGIPSVVIRTPAATSADWPICSGRPQAKGQDEKCSIVFKYGMKRDFNAWLASLGPARPVKTLDRAAGMEHGASQAAARSSTVSHSSTSPTRWTWRRDRARYQADRAKDVELGGARGSMRP